MLKPSRFFRIIHIFQVLLKYMINRRVLSSNRKFARTLSYLNPYSYNAKASRGEALRLSFEKLGPIFVKFGQLLSIRGDLFPHDVIIELQKLQDNVAPFKSEKAIAILERYYQQPVNEVFQDFNPTPLASASISQVHSAKLPTGEDVVIKILRPKIKRTILSDIALMKTVARWVERLLHFGKRLRPLDLVTEFEHTITNELDLQQEAASANTLKRNFNDSKIMYVPTVYWDYCAHHIMVMERIYGVPINQVDVLRKQNVDLKKLAEYGVEIFFTQVFRDSFFHADMHPGNLFVDTTNPSKPRYIGVDFGIMGSLSEDDQRYIGENLLAFFNRDYRQVAKLHIESGWVPADTRVDQFEAAIRSVSEPIFQKSLNEISFGKLFLQLIRVAGSFKMETQPQLLLLQKTLLGIESLGRKLYPELDLWNTAKPFLENWIRQRKSPRRLLKQFIDQLQPNTERLLQLPEKLDHFLSNASSQHQSTPDKPNRLKNSGFILGSLTLLTSTVLAWLGKTTHPWVGLTITVLLFLINMLYRQTRP